jgi:hypothetical protein
MKYKALTVVICFIFLCPLISFAQSSKPFGGKSTFITPCTCDGSFMVTILDVVSYGVPTNYIYSPITTTLLGYMLILTPGANMIGLASPMQSQCMITNPGSGCVASGFGHSMILVGTSL